MLHRRNGKIADHHWFLLETDGIGAAIFTVNAADKRRLSRYQANRKINFNRAHYLVIAHHLIETKRGGIEAGTKRRISGCW